MKKFLFYKGKRISKVGFFGLGRSNLALFNYLSENYEGLSFMLRSDKAIGKKDGFSELLYEKAARIDITEDVLFLSPSVRRDSEEFLLARRQGVILSSDVEFFFEQRRVPVFSVTGSDGKSTTATLASLFLSSDEGDFPASANIGLPMTSLLGNPRLRGTVAELSSFQLMDFSPTSERAVITNVSENHLDWHTSFNEYLYAKENVLRFAKKRIFNLDCPYSRTISEKYPAFAVFSTELTHSELCRTVTANHYFTVENGYICSSGEPLFTCDRIKVSGNHNLSNFLAAMALTAELVSTEKIIGVAESFEGLSHRARLVGNFNGIYFYDSSIDSTPTRTAVTLRAIKSPIILILGGRGKRLSYSPLFPLPKNVKAVVLTGENKYEILKEFTEREKHGEISVKILLKNAFSDAVAAALQEAVSGDAVLLSPASTSFDSFTDYKERGDAFSEIIKNYYTEK